MLNKIVDRICARYPALWDWLLQRDHVILTCLVASMYTYLLTQMLSVVLVTIVATVCAYRLGIVEGERQCKLIYDPIGKPNQIIVSESMIEAIKKIPPGCSMTIDPPDSEVSFAVCHADDLEHITQLAHLRLASRKSP